MQFKQELDIQQQHTKQILTKFEQFKLRVNKSMRILEEKINEILLIVFPEQQIIDTLLNTIDTQDFEQFDDLVKTCRIVESSEIIAKLERKLDFKFAKWKEILDKTLALDKSIIPKAGQLIMKFDELAKFPSIQIQQDGQSVLQTQSTNHYAIACLDYSYNNFGDEQIMQYKMINAVGDVGVGVCELETVQEKAFRPRLSELGSGTFICFQDRYTVHTTNKLDNWVVRVEQEKKIVYTIGQQVEQLQQQGNLKSYHQSNVIQNQQVSTQQWQLSSNLPFEKYGYCEEMPEIGREERLNSIQMQIIRVQCRKKKNENETSFQGQALKQQDMPEQLSMQKNN